MSVPTYSQPSAETAVDGGEDPRAPGGNEGAAPAEPHPLSSPTAGLHSPWPLTLPALPTVHTPDEHLTADDEMHDSTLLAAEAAAAAAAAAAEGESLLHSSNVVPHSSVSNGSFYGGNDPYSPFNVSGQCPLAAAAATPCAVPVYAHAAATTAGVHHRWQRGQAAAAAAHLFPPTGEPQQFVRSPFGCAVPSDNELDLVANSRYRISGRERNSTG